MGLVNIMKKRPEQNFRFTFLWISIFVIFLSACSNKPDYINIKNVIPSGPVKPGIVVPLTVEIEYYLGSCRKGEIGLGFNIGDKEGQFRIVNTTIVTKQDEVATETMYVNIEPVDWGGHFRAYAYLAEADHEGGFDPLKKTQKKIPLTE